MEPDSAARAARPSRLRPTQWPASVVALAVVAVVAVQLAAAYWAVGRDADGAGLVLADGYPLGGDFILYYSASSLLAAEGADAVYDPARLAAAQAAILGADGIGYWAWFYAPTLLLLAKPLAWMPFEAALGAWNAVWLGLFLLVAYRVLPYRLTLVAALLFPAASDALFSGQNGVLSFALLGAGLLLLERRPVLAGLLLGFLIYKPQLGLLLPIALIAGGHWRAVAGATVAVALYIALGLAVFGAEVWRTYLDALPLAGIAFDEGTTRWTNMPSVLIAGRLLGLSLPLAWALQALAALGAAVAVAWLWRRPASLGLKAAGLVAAMPLAAPYVQFYDMVIVLLAILWLVGESLDGGRRRSELLIVLLVWLTPVIAGLAAGTLGLQPWPIVLAGLLAVVLRRAAAAGRDDGRWASPRSGAP